MITIIFNQPVTTQSMRDLQVGINSAVRQESDLQLIINTTGGSLEDAVATVKYVESLPSHVNVTTVNPATCQSGGLLLFGCGQKRIALSKSTFMGHGPSMQTAINPSNRQGLYDFNKDSVALLKECYEGLFPDSDNTFLSSICIGNPVYFDAAGALENGTATHIENSYSSEPDKTLFV